MRQDLRSRSERTSQMGSRKCFWGSPSRLVVACVAIVTLAGCSSGASKTPAATATKSPIIIGGIASTTSFKGTELGFQARIDALNKQGGIDGHPIQFVGVLDDGGSGVTNLTDIQQLILKDHVVAVAPVNSVGLLSSSAAFAANQQTPVLGWGFIPTFCNNKWVWGFNGCLEPTGVYNSSLVEPMLTELGGNAKTIRAASVQNNNAAGIAGNALYKALWTRLGANFVGGSTAMPISGVTDYAPYVAAVLAQKPNVIALGLVFAENLAFKAALVQAGYTGATFDYVSYVPGILASQPAIASALQNEYVGVQIPPQEEETPATKQMTKDITASGQPPLVSLGESLGYWQADMLIQMLQATAKAGRPLTGAGLGKTVNAGFTYKGTLAGGLGSATFPQVESVPVPCAGLLRVTGTVYKVYQPFTCYKNIAA
jgi:branched-chain amino acid transport system substrate-binding protein